jgi:macrolide-specific efflux system membrane fusion protein
MKLFKKKFNQKKQQFRFMKSITNNIYILLFSSLLLLNCGGKNETTTPQTRNITDAIFASGFVSYSDEYWATANTEGFILNSYHREGDEVKNKQNLFQLSSEIQTLQSYNAQANYADAISNANSNSPQISKLKNKIVQAEKTLNLDTKNYNRHKKLIVSNAVSQLDFENIKLQYENAIVHLEIQKKSLKDLQNKMNLQVKNTKNQLDIQKKYVLDYLIKSASNGIVLEITKKTGELAKKGELLARIGGGKLMAKLYIAEEDINKIALHQKAILSLNTDTKRTYNAKVSKIYPSFNDKEQSFVIEVSFTNEVPKLLSGTQVQANIVFEERINSLIIPSRFLSENNTIILKSGKEKTIELGIINSEWVEVLKGVDENTTIVLPKTK